MKSGTLLLDASDLCALIERVGKDRFMIELINRLESFIKHLDPTTVQVPLRTGVQYSTPHWGLVETMPAYARHEGTTVKLVGYHPANPKRFSKPSVVSTIAVFDPETGGLNGLMDGTLLTAIRTGAASAVASRILAQPASKCLGLIGCGAQAVTQVHALSQHFGIERVIGYDIDEATAQSLKDRLSFCSAEVETIEREELPSLLERAEILCTCTSSIPGEGPVFEHSDHQSSLHINAIGSDFPEKFELPHSLLQEALIAPDFREQAILEGECQQLEEDQIGPDFVKLVQNAEGYESARDRLTVFDSTGWALEDHVAARMVLEYAAEMKLGRYTDLECMPPDPKDPYSLLSTLPVAPSTLVEMANPVAG